MTTSETRIISQQEKVGTSDMLFVPREEKPRTYYTEAALGLTAVSCMCALLALSASGSSRTDSRVAVNQALDFDPNCVTLNLKSYNFNPEDARLTVQWTQKDAIIDSQSISLNPGVEPHTATVCVLPENNDVAITATITAIYKTAESTPVPLTDLYPNPLATLQQPSNP